MDLTEVLTGLASAKAQYNKLVADAAEPLKQQLVDEVKKLGIKGVVWTQYTPYFNDGDTCEFSLHGIGLIIGDPADVRSPYSGDDTVLELDSTYDTMKKYYGEQLAKANIDKETYEATSKAFSTLWKLEDVLEQAFGDHAIVKVTPEGVIVKEYSHD